jgi:hypothetical protein
MKALDLSDSRQRPGRLCASEIPFSAIATEGKGGRSSGNVHGPPLRFRADFSFYYFPFLVFSSPFLSFYLFI